MLTAYFKYVIQHTYSTLYLIKYAYSISLGMLMTLAGLASKLMMIDLYDTVHKNYQLVRSSQSRYVKMK